MRILTLNNGLSIMVGLDESHLLERLSDITLKSELENQYGAININVEDGTYTEIEKEEEVLENV